MRSWLGCRAITGLYTSILCLVGYAAARAISHPRARTGLVIGTDDRRHDPPARRCGRKPTRAIALASMLAILVGGMMILAGVAKLGFVADLLSKPTQIGYMTGLALTILVGQLPKLFGFSVRLRHT